MFNLSSDKTLFAELPLTFRDQNGPRDLPSGSLAIEIPPDTEGAGGEIVETVVDGRVQFTARLIPGTATGVYRFSIVDNTPNNDNLRIEPLEIEYTTTEESVVTIDPGTATFRPRTELPA